MDHFSAADGTRLAYLDHGTGLPVLALAGLTRDSRDFDYLAPFMTGVRFIRLDSRGRGQSGWSGADSYTPLQEAQDALALMDHLGIEQFAVIGSSRGGILGMLIAALAPARLLGLCLNDIGPIIEPAGLERIAAYIGRRPTARTLAQMADRLPAANPGFDGVPASRWAEEAERHFTVCEDGLGLTYDPDLAKSFQAAMSAPAVDLWPLFDACQGRPLALIRGENSDLLSRKTAQDMQARAPGLDWIDVPNRAHIPFLDEPQSIATITGWINRL